MDLIRSLMKEGIFPAQPLYNCGIKKKALKKDLGKTL
ncbi:hypothetical protein GGE08_002703 [Muricauda sp. ARW1Y1]|jgi:hypothetical protein|nr:hypothetical protein [Muricauda sp. ARW1Y1]